MKNIDEVRFKQLIKKLHKGLRVRFKETYVYIDGSKKYHRLTMPQYSALKETGFTVSGNITGFPMRDLQKWIKRLEKENSK